ncbi:competence type IV pilus ATPase ComGA [Isobaculum melis]|uniref:Competence protein ComGA n=1 Tax=Isobaculum melis TaxID=142588 RepID=A0A1H9TWA9_9LACT|nr:competence type IV pilus ATPase ComGA [Isobaculum melis]SES01389.1 competence protein ComGA [Isobaculum melis]
MTIEEIAQEILITAQNQQISDIHLLPTKHHYQLYFRYLDSLQLQQSYSLEEGEKIILYFKYLGEMNVGEKRKPQSGAAKITLLKRAFDLRFSVLSNFRAQESLVIRLLKQQQLFQLEKQVFLPQQLIKIKELLTKSKGLIIFSGPVDSGKTTTMYELLKPFAQTEKMQVITIEDPVEIEAVDFFQAQVNEKSGVTYASLLKASLRHHPDIIIVGEIRDEETAKMTIRIALTGHLVLTTVHAQNAIGVIARLIDLGVSEEQLKQTINGIIYQRLLPETCCYCIENCTKSCQQLSGKMKRKVLFELLAGDDLKEFFLQKTRPKHFPTFQYYLRKVYAYGYLSEKNYQKYAQL